MIYFYLLVALLCIELPAFAAIHLGLSGTAQNRHLTESNINEYSGSASVAVDVGRYFRVGYTYQRDEETQKGSIPSTNAANVEGRESYTAHQTMVMQSIDLTLVPIAGERVMPYIFGGIAQKNYLIWRQFEYYNLGQRVSDTEDFRTWNAGIGMAVGISRNMQFKVTNSWSPGRVFNEDGTERKDVIDTFLKFGISYRL